jgi:cell division protein ZapA (FtsZ GTPase activity inhibitor)
MNVDTKKYRVTIGGQSYAFISDEFEEQIQEAATIVDSLITQMQAKSTDVDGHRVAVLAAIKLALDVVHAKTAKRHEQARVNLLLERLDGLLTALH